ncbi:MAG: hypothetical protein ABJO27_11325 [Pseudoruegeria sp.]
MQGSVFLPPLNITQCELEVLELGLALALAPFGHVISADARTLGDKVCAALPRPEMLDLNRGSINVYHTKFSDPECETLEDVRRVILARTTLRFDYLSLKQKRSTRCVCPVKSTVTDNTPAVCWFRNRVVNSANKGKTTKLCDRTINREPIKVSALPFTKLAGTWGRGNVLHDQ